RMRATSPFRLSVVAAFLAAAGCDSPTAPELRQPRTVRIVSGDAQTGTVARPLPAPLVVKVLDRHRRPVPGRLVGFTVLGGGSVTLASATTDLEGYARTEWTLGTSTADSQRVVAAVLGNGADRSRSAAFRVEARPDVPERMMPVADSACTGSVGMPLPDSLAVRVVDHYGNAVPGAPVVWRVLAGDGTISPEISVAGSDGVARAMWTLGTRLDTAQVAEAAAGMLLRAKFVATAGVGLGVRLRKVAGDGQTAEVGTQLADSLRVQLTLADGRPVVGAPIAWAAADGGTFSPPESVTDANGEAAAAWTLGEPPGVMTATASFGGMEPAVFMATAVQVFYVRPLHAYPGHPDWPRPLVGAANSVLDDTLGIIVTDRHARPMAGLEVGWRVSGGSVSPVVSVTDAEGVARTQWTLGAAGVAGAYASIGGREVAVIGGFAVRKLYAGPEDSLLARAGTTVEVSVETIESNLMWMPVQGAVVHWTVLSGGGSVSPAVTRTQGTNREPQGLVTAAFTRWTLGPPGPQTLRATLGNLQVTLTATALDTVRRVRLTQVPGHILDATRDRVLWLDRTGGRSVRLRDVASGTDVTIMSGLAADPELAMLFSAGALVRVGAGPAPGLYEWRNHTLSLLMDGRASVQGEWAAWNGAGGIHRRNLSTGITAVVVDHGNVLAVAPNGDVVFGTPSGPGWLTDLWRFRDGQIISVSQGRAVEAVYADEVNVALRYPSGSLGAYGVSLILGAPPTGEFGLISMRTGAYGYESFGGALSMAGGWTAWSEMVYPGIGSSKAGYPVARRHPVPVNAGGIRTKIEAISPTGALVFRSATRRYLDVPGGPAADWGPAAAGESVIWRGGAFLLITADGTLYELL
ncbi:MAG TPA: hypothetical protein VFR37_06615, partial [Longimicrobium sp.]|nr:hypothetical protein [Longimicrobium sp.]